MSGAGREKRQGAGLLRDVCGVPEGFLTVPERVPERSPKLEGVPEGFLRGLQTGRSETNGQAGQPRQGRALAAVN
eukprot:15484814-Alexandrium_andersonii.AAC.1